MVEKGETEKKLYYEPIENFKRRKRIILLATLLVSILIILIGIIPLIDYWVSPSGYNSNIYLFSISFIILGFVTNLLVYYLNYKPLNRFVMYEIGLYTRLGKNLITYNEINYARIRYYQYLPPILHILYRENHEIYYNLPEAEMKNIIKVLRKKGVHIKLGDSE